MEKLQNLKKHELIKIASQLKNQINSNKNLLNSIELLQKLELKYNNMELKNIIELYKKQKIKTYKINYKYYLQKYNKKNIIKIIKVLHQNMISINKIINNIDNKNIHYWILKMAHANKIAYNEYYVNSYIDYILKFY